MRHQSTSISIKALQELPSFFAPILQCPQLRIPPPQRWYLPSCSQMWCGSAQTYCRIHSSSCDAAFAAIQPHKKFCNQAAQLSSLLLLPLSCHVAERTSAKLWLLATIQRCDAQIRLKEMSILIYVHYISSASTSHMFASLCSTAEMAPLVMFIQVTDKDRTPPKLDPHLWRSLISNSKWSGRNPKKYKKKTLTAKKDMMFELHRKLFCKLQSLNCNSSILFLKFKWVQQSAISWRRLIPQKSPMTPMNTSQTPHKVKPIHSEETRPKLGTPSSPSGQNSGFPPCYEGFLATLRSPERHWGGDAPRSRRSDGWARWNAYIDPWPHRGDFHM